MSKNSEETEEEVLGMIKAVGLLGELKTLILKICGFIVKASD